nr:MAG TPA: hypothetical protein [Caudoviricetes sp.]
MSAIVLMVCFSFSLIVSSSFLCVVVVLLTL